MRDLNLFRQPLRRLSLFFLPSLLLGFAVLTFSAVPALAEATSPQWTVTAVSLPTNINPAAKPGEDSYVVTLTNTGGASSVGPVEVTDELPAGLALDQVGASGEDPLDGSSPHAGFVCTLRTCVYAGVVVPGATLSFSFPVDVLASPPASCGVPAGAVSCVTNVVRVSGGGALSASMQTPTVISQAPAGYGFAAGGAANALSSYQAGAHPDFTTSIAFNTIDASGSVPQFNKDLVDNLPAGFAGDLVDTPACTGADFVLEKCPNGSQVGITTVTLSGSGGSVGRIIKPVYNLTPNSGEVAKIGFLLGSGDSFEAGVSLREPGERGPAGELLEPYGLKTTFPNFNESFAPITNVSLTVWGVPAEAIHDPLRWNGGRPGEGAGFGATSAVSPAPYFTNPTSCGAQPAQAEVEIDSWEAPEHRLAVQMPFASPIVGCGRLTIEPSLTAEPTSDKAASATGLDVDTRIPQTYSNAEGLATSTLKKEVVTLPQGMTVNPSSGAGLQGCSEAQYAEEATQYLEGHGCPNQSRLATVEIVTPSLSEHVKGSLFLAEPAGFGEAGRNPFNLLLAVYLIARIPARGVLIESPGLVEPNLVTGQLTTTFDDLPPLPFSLATFSFNSGANAPLVTPPVCGSYTLTAALTPYSNPAGAPFEPLIPPFSISSGVAGGPCPVGGIPPFAPGVTAGTENGEAGAYSPLNILIARNDGEQEITGFASQLPPGLTGNLTGIEKCSEADVQRAREQTGVQAEASPACPAGSEIGTTVADAGVGSVLAQAPGRLYLGEGFEGAPFSVVAVTAAHVGPFDLGTVVVHLPLNIDPETAAVSIPAGPADQIPHIIKGIVIDVREIRVFIHRHDFMLNPTSCKPLSFAATVIGAGANPVNPAGYDPVSVANPFQVTNCAKLQFAPKFNVTTSGKTSKADGASLTAKLTYPTGALGSDANIKYVKVDLPKQLPSRLTTLQKACTSAQFNANPAGCPAASDIGHARAITPILPVPLEGPAYFVSHGGEAFPDLEVVLQGDGVKIVLTGNTFISKSGITSSTFKTVPDQPVTSFELILPEGPDSALAANGNLCSLTKTVTVKKKVTVRVKGRRKTETRKVKQTQPASLQMPTAFIGQNGAEIHRTTPISVSGCGKSKPAKKATKKRAKKGKKK